MNETERHAYTIIMAVMNHLLGDVKAHGVHHVSEEEEIDLALAVPVIDVANVLDLGLINHLQTDRDTLISSPARISARNESVLTSNINSSIALSLSLNAKRKQML